eukprot:gnl/Spiro4/24240_TR12033_c0_g1_i2.p1 gnl/Spiro4/24240_TR12033_c0_g1~~gnl/Spiro4/24240_TR12033_c0_g1_i2.p1  ORF type:complete len:501 (+),score=149.50 gnl/Spiro4/24240_TR12033_c0_g1_i2:129-1505(+)
MEKTAKVAPFRADFPAARYFTVAQDHFDGSNSNTWQQAYYVNDTFWKPGSTAPIFLCVGGEGPALDGSAVVASVHCNVAVELLPSTGALMFALEHRYYGCHNMSACPVPSFANFSVGLLRFLSSRQALGDVVAFHQYAVAAYGLTAANKWISWGGSYPGMLAGWTRVKFPHLFHGAVASSAPVQAVMDMPGYNDVAAYAYSVADNNVGGSQDCRQAIADGHVTVGQMLATDAGRATLAQMFSLPSAQWLQDPANQLAFAGEGVANFPSQENDPSCDTACCDIASICRVMTNQTVGSPVQRLGAVFQLQKSAQSPAASAADDLPDFWGYQTCTEFGFYQTCEVGSQCFFTQGLATLSSQMAFCSSEFGIPASQVASNIDYTNAYYGGWTPSGSRLLYPNGEVDPWRSQSVAEPLPGVATMFVLGASHHFWTHPSLPTDQPSVVQARQQIRKTVLQWLQE